MRRRPSNRRACGPSARRTGSGSTSRPTRCSPATRHGRRACGRTCASGSIRMPRASATSTPTTSRPTPSRRRGDGLRRHSAPSMTPGASARSYSNTPGGSRPRRTTARNSRRSANGCRTTGSPSSFARPGGSRRRVTASGPWARSPTTSSCLSASMRRRSPSCRGCSRSRTQSCSRCASTAGPTRRGTTPRGPRPSDSATATRPTNSRSSFRSSPSTPTRRARPTCS